MTGMYVGSMCLKICLQTNYKMKELKICFVITVIKYTSNQQTLSILLSEAIQINDKSHNYDFMRVTLNYITYVTSQHVLCDYEVSKIRFSNMKSFAQIQYEKPFLMYS